MKKSAFSIVLNGMLSLLGIAIMAIAVTLANNAYTFTAITVFVVGGGILLFATRNIEND